jgi:chorismate mutase / prephenate dehydratase
MSIKKLRQEIDEIDSNLIKILAKRMRVAERIGKEKLKSSKEIIDINRENEVLEKVRALATNERINLNDIENIYRQIILVTRRKEVRSVAFQGEIGAYSEEAAFSYFGSSIDTKPFETLEDVFKSVELDETEYGIVPIENSLEGSIGLSYDLLLDSNLKVCGETELRISHCLIANPDATLDSLKLVYSHPQALGQSRTFLKHLNVELVPTYDTAGSVKMVKQTGSTDSGAVASHRAAEIYGMQIIAREIEDNRNNFTRFFILSKHDSLATGNDKTSLVFSVSNNPGFLYHFLGKWAKNGINLTKGESRPTRRKPWDYNFYLDIEGHREDEKVKDVLAKLEKSAIFLKVLGSYPKVIKK